MPPMGGAPNTPTGGAAMPPPVNPPTNRLDSLMGAAGPVTGMGGEPMPEDNRLDSLMGGMEEAPMMLEDEGLAVSDVATGLATAAVETSGGDIDMARASLMEALAELDAMEMGS